MATSKKRGAKKAGKRGAAKSVSSPQKRAGARSIPSGATARNAPAAPTPAAEVSSTETLTVTVLQRGSSGPEVETLQNELVDLGYLRRAQMATGAGNFGPLTEDAVKHLQRDNFLTENGTYDSATQEVIRQINEGVRRCP